MAAPCVPKSQDSCLKKLNDHEKFTAKVSRKNILCPQFQEWPRPSTETAELILSKLSDKLKSHPNIFKSLKTASKSDQEDKHKIRCQLEIGVSSVFRALEKGRLSCVLVSGQAKPAAVVDHVISLARERGCPLLCLDDLSTTVSSVTKTKVLPLCIGFKTVTTEARYEFTEIVSLILANSKVAGPPSSNNNKMSISCTDLEELPAKLLPEYFRPVAVDIGRENEILNDLKRILSDSTIKSTAERNAGGKKKKRKKPKLKLKENFIKSIHCQFEIGKRTVTEILIRRKLQLVVVSADIVPHLMTESSSSSLLTLAREVTCPVICQPGLTAALKPVAGGNISVIGFKKFTSLPPGATPVFRDVVEKYLEAIQKSPSSLIQDDPIQSVEVEVDNKSSSATVRTQSQNGNMELRKISKTEADEDKDEEEEEEEEDYSYLHIMKKDSKLYQDSMTQVKQEIAAFLRNENLQASFISLNSADKTTSEVILTDQANPAKRKQGDDWRKCDNESKARPKKRHIEMSHYGGADELEGVISKHRCDQNKGNISPPASCQDKEMVINDDNKVVSGKTLEKEESPSQKLTSTEAVSTSSFFTISRKGDISAKSTPEKDLASRGTKSKFNNEEILGDKIVLTATKTEAEKEAEHIKKVFEATAISSKCKKKKKKNAPIEGFISLAYTPANIHTMVNDVSKKRKKKKKKK